MVNQVFRSRAPLRISFVGGGTDLPQYSKTFDGAVISTTIDRYAYVSLQKNSKKGLRIISQDYNLLEKFQTISEKKIGGKMSLVKASLLLMGLKRDDLDITIHVDSPPGSGLGSSSAVAVSLIGCLNNYLNTDLDSYEIAEKAIKLEREMVGIKGGLQDHYASTFGGFNFIEFSKSVTVNPLRLKSEILNELLASIILLDTKQTRLSGKILQHQIKLYNQQDPSTLQNLQFIKDSVFKTKELLLKGKIAEIGILLDSYWKYKKKISVNISNPKIDKIYSIAKKSGALGGKILGAGGGGHMMFLGDPDTRQKIIKSVSSLGVGIVKFNFDKTGVQTWTVRNGKVLN